MVLNQAVDYSKLHFMTYACICLSWVDLSAVCCCHSCPSCCMDRSHADRACGMMPDYADIKVASMQAANYLNIVPILKITGKKVADDIKGEAWKILPAKSILLYASSGPVLK